MDLQEFAMMLINKNPSVQNNPNAKFMIEAIRNNDSEKGMKIAQNLCDSYGVTKEEGLKQARSFFGL